MVFVKICGVTSVEDAFMCVEAGADFIGTIVDIPSSPRSVSIGKSREILSALQPRVKGVVVMASKSPQDVIEAVEFIQPWGVQLHGGEKRDFIKKVKESVSVSLIKAIPVEGEKSIDRALFFADVCDALLLDTAAGSLGGSGKTHDWRVSSQIVKLAECQVFLAGGLNPGNIIDAVKTVNPYCADTSSGVEKTHRKKDLKKVRDFVIKAKKTNSQGPSF